MEVNGENKLMHRHSFIFCLEDLSPCQREFSKDNYCVKRKPVFNYSLFFNYISPTDKE